MFNISLRVITFPLMVMAQKGSAKMMVSGQRCSAGAQKAAPRSAAGRWGDNAQRRSIRNQGRGYGTS